ncbi:type II toxin-antitoxin system ParD family antitoxin [Falsirhodobacter sp. 1013]|uniref:type II toxin-antitoxin system ParD family antitoxin n=1 Tax=Falsirhodobacter sp. 1013 TaxID=3417566 RepID=UPI003EB937C3
MTSDTTQTKLDLVEEHEAKVRALEAALTAGEASGEPQPFDPEAFKARMYARHSKA